ncbi:MAG: DUF6596 domain-containing protein [Tetrasphaera sp.]
MPDEAAAAAEQAHRRSWGRLLAGTLRATGDLALAEEACADAFELALQQWPRDGVPRSVEAWLLTVARRRAVDLVRRAATGRAKLALLAAEVPAAGYLPESDLFADDDVRLLALCCHPGLAPEAQLALTLRLACGVPTAAIAAAFLVSPATMAARLTRAKARLRPGDLALPDDVVLEERMPAIRAAVRLAYGLGHTAGHGVALRGNALAGYAVRLAHTLYLHRLGDQECAGLFALLLLTEARAPTRVDAADRQTLLPDADRTAWDRALLAEAATVLAGLDPPSPSSGPLALEARIGAEHSFASSYAATNWLAVIALYDLWLAREPSPVVALGRCLAVAEIAGPHAGLADLEEVLAIAGPALERYPYAHAGRARLLGLLERHTDAAAAWERAAACARTDAERDYFVGRAAGERG